MARLTVLLLGLFATAWGQDTDAHLKKAGVCGRCHVISVVEWGMSGHARAGTGCVACHGESKGHVADERNNIKPDRIPRKEAVAGLCATCHAQCPKTSKTAGCESCHHAHALIDPKAPPSVKDARLERMRAAWERAARHFAEGERLFQAGEWRKARDEFKASLSERPGDRRSADRLAACERRLAPPLAGFDAGGAEWDTETGLPRLVRVSGLGIAMALVPGGEMDIGADSIPNATPVHTVEVKPFYLATVEVTQALWERLMHANPSARKGKDLPVEQVSWEDARAFIAKLNQLVPGGGFRLPTEVEWEFAARAGGPATAWYDGDEHPAGPRAVAAGAPNKLGIYDLQGNVWEWCSSLYQPYPYSRARAERTPASGLRVLRGGAYNDTAGLMDPAARHGERPERRLPWNGLRLARGIPGN